MDSDDPAAFVLWSDEELRHRLRQLKAEARKIQREITNRKLCTKTKSVCGLALKEVERYSRQLLLPEVSVKGQLKLKRSKGVLIVGAGGLGCPSAMYLAAAGVGRIGVLDHDVVDLSNLHRQVLHTEETLGQPKAASVRNFIESLNSGVVVEVFDGVPLTSHNALDIVSGFDVVLDATDNVPTRYLLNDACVMSGIPLVSGSALRMEGQLTVYNFPIGVGPTYRCLFPSPPPPDAVTNCSDGGILGGVTGVIGCLQAVEAIKILIASPGFNVLCGKMLIYDASTCEFRTVKLRHRRPSSDVEKLVDYEMFCGALATDKDIPNTVLSLEDRIEACDYNNSYLNGKKHLLIDVRSAPEMEICSLENSLNIPIGELMNRDVGVKKIDKILEENPCHEIVVCCRKGNDSQRAVLRLKRHFASKGNMQIKDIVGGLHAWNRNVDSNFPLY